MVLRAAAFAVLVGQTVANSYVPPRGIDVARRHGGNWSQKSTGDDGRLSAGNPHTQDGPLLGNADLSAVLQFDRSGSVFSYYVTKTDAWSTNDIFGLGVVTLEIPALNGSSQLFIRQDLGSATTVIDANTSAPDDSTASGVAVSMSSFIAATTNIMSTSISITTPSATQLVVANAVYSGVRYETDPKTRMPTGAPARTLANCTDFDNNGVRNRGPHNAGFAAADADAMWGLYIQCTKGNREASRLGLATRILTPSAADVTLSAPECGPISQRSGLMSSCTTTINVPAGTTELTVLSSSLSNINMAGDGTPGPQTTLENVEELRKATVALIGSATPATVLNLQSEHAQWWAEFWNASAVSFPSQPDFEAYYYRSMHLLGSSTRQTSAVPPGLCGAWFAGGGPSRYGDFTLNYNFGEWFWLRYCVSYYSVRIDPK
jgi:hypothetical protein